MKAALEESAGVRCHQKLSSGKMLMDCETSDSCAGERVGHEEPFCGRFSAKNPWAVYSKGEEEEGYYLDSSSGMVSSAPPSQTGHVFNYPLHRKILLQNICCLM